MVLRSSVLISFFLFLIFTVESKDIDIEKLKKEGKEIDYTEKVVEKQNNKVYNFNKKNHLESNKNTDGIYFAIIIIVALFIIVVFYTLNKKQRFKADSSIKRNDLLFELENINILHIDDLNRLYEESILAKNYNECIRYIFLLLFKKLIDHQIITYAKNKTNAEYAKEITHSDLLILFKDISHIFNLARYKNTTMSEQEYLISLTIYKEASELIKMR